MFGVFSLWLFGVMTYLYPRLLSRPWYSHKLCEWHYWLSSVGLFVMFIDLTLAGVFQGYYWAALLPWEVSVDGSQPFWHLRVAAGLTMFGGLLCFLYNLWMTTRGATTPAPETSTSVAVLGS
jgi:cytochrome c oxidase cbb3-type subunit 1